MKKWERESPSAELMVVEETVPEVAFSSANTQCFLIGKSRGRGGETPSWYN